MKKIYAFGLLVLTFQLHAQIIGTVTDNNNQTLPYVNIYLENTYNSTITNESGVYELPINKAGSYTVIFQYLGFQTIRKSINPEKFPFTLNVSMKEETLSLNEAVVNSADNPANEIIRKAIKNKKANSEKTARYRADFYSRGIFRIKDAPKTVLGQKLDAFDDILDSTRSGILYLSETVSKLTFQKPDKMKEVIVASKVSGNDNGFSFNNAASANFDFYENYVPFNAEVVSPIADNAFNYYKYKLEGTFFYEDKIQISKIQVIPRRDSEPAMFGYIYIVDDSYAIYGTELSVLGKNIQTPVLNKMLLKQTFSYNKNNDIWIKNTQTLDFDAGMLGIKIDGRFTYVYNNFEFEDKFAKNTFTREVLSFEKDANKKEDSFWEEIRPVPLTEEESTDYLKKDILQTKKKSQVYLDSIDQKSNKFKVLDIVSGYNYKNSFKNWSVGYKGLLTGISFNTVQGYKVLSGFYYTKRNEENRTYTSISADFDYGLAEDRFRGVLSYNRKFNNINNSQLFISGGSSIVQFNSANPISNLINAVATTFFKDNYMKLYERNFVGASYSREVINGLFVTGSLSYNDRNPLFNNTKQALLKNERGYISNNPLLPNDFITPAFDRHNLYKAALTAKINFGQEYWSRPDGKFNIRNEKYPTLYITAEKSFAANEKRYEYEHIQGRIFHDLSLQNKGLLGMNLKIGKLFNADNISFVDYKHFNGNRTHIGQSDRYLNTFNLLPYYSASTNDSYVEFHAEHNDKGYIINKIPLLNKLQLTMNLGYHNLAIPDRSPYHEFTIGLDNLGIKKFRMFRVDYIRSYQHGYQGDGVLFGAKFLNLLD